MDKLRRTDGFKPVRSLVDDLDLSESLHIAFLHVIADVCEFNSLKRVK